MTEKTKKDDQTAAREASLSAPICSAWRVDVYVRGYFSGSYDHATEDEAHADAIERRKKFGVLGCNYIVAKNDESEEEEFERGAIAIMESPNLSQNVELTRGADSNQPKEKHT